MLKEIIRKYGDFQDRDEMATFTVFQELRKLSSPSHSQNMGRERSEVATDERVGAESAVKSRGIRVSSTEGANPSLPISSPSHSKAPAKNGKIDCGFNAVDDTISQEGYPHYHSGTDQSRQPKEER